MLDMIEKEKRETRREEIKKALAEKTQGIRIMLERRKNIGLEENNNSNPLNKPEEQLRYI